jgi:hypothetical protein
VAYWLRRAVELGDDDDEVFSPCTIIKATETVSGFGLGRVWAVLACSAGAVLGCDVVVMGCCDAEVQVSFPPLLISNFCFAFCFLV